MDSIRDYLRRIETAICMRLFGSSSLYHWWLKWPIVGFIRPLYYCERPWREFWRLVWPISPWKRHFPYRLLSISEIHANPKLVQENQKDFHLLRFVSLWAARDTPLRALYRIYEDACIGDDYAITSESTDFFFRTDWKVEEIPDPHDPDPARYMAITCLAEIMADVCNERIEKGLLRHLGSWELALIQVRGDPLPSHEERVAALERPPPWTRNVPPLEKPVSLFPPGADDSNRNGYMESRNIIANVANMYFL